MEATQKSTCRSVRLNSEQVRAIRQALLIGLSSYGEIERLIDQHDMAKILHDPRPVEEMRPIHPSADVRTICDFANALRYLDVCEVSEAANG